MKVRDIMTRDVCSIGPDETVEHIAQQLVDRHISALPVVGDGRVVGIVSESDLLHRKELGTDRRRRGWRRWLANPDTLARDYARSRALKAGDIMTAPVVTAAPNATLAEAAELMQRYEVKRLPVVEHGRLVGILSRADMVRALAVAAARPAKPTDDAIILEAMHQRLRAQPWTGGASVDVQVADRVVTLNGLVASEEQLQAVRVMAETIPGVAAVTCALEVRPALVSVV